MGINLAAFAYYNEAHKWNFIQVKTVQEQIILVVWRFTVLSKWIYKCMFVYKLFQHHTFVTYSENLTQ